MAYFQWARERVSGWGAGGLGGILPVGTREGGWLGGILPVGTGEGGWGGGWVAYFQWARERVGGWVAGWLSGWQVGGLVGVAYLLLLAA